VEAKIVCVHHVSQDWTEPPLASLDISTDLPELTCRPSLRRGKVYSRYREVRALVPFVRPLISYGMCVRHWSVSSVLQIIGIEY